jgi:hypothetical protein
MGNPRARGGTAGLVLVRRLLPLPNVGARERAIAARRERAPRTSLGSAARSCYVEQAIRQALQEVVGTRRSREGWGEVGVIRRAGGRASRLAVGDQGESGPHPERSEGPCSGMARTRPGKVPRCARDEEALLPPHLTVQPSHRLAARPPVRFPIRLISVPPATPPPSTPPSRRSAPAPSSIPLAVALAPPGRLWLRPVTHSTGRASRSGRVVARARAGPRRPAACGWRRRRCRGRRGSCAPCGRRAR